MRKPNERPRSSGVRVLSRATVLGLALGSNLALGCQSEVPATNPVTRDPIGIRVKGSTAVPAFTLGLTLTHGTPPRSMIEPLTRAVHDAVRGCPGVIADGKAGLPTVLAVRFENDELRLAGAPQGGGSHCVADAIAGASVPTPFAGGVEAELRLIFEPDGAPH